MRTVVFLFAFVFPCWMPSQEAQEPILAPPAKRAFRYPGKIETSYDQSKDLSIIFFKLLPIKALEDPKSPGEVQFSDEWLHLTAYFVHPGTQLITPQWVTIGFLSSTENPQKYKEHALAMKIDGVWANLGTMTVLSRTNYTRRARLPLVSETMELPVPYKRFLSLVNAKKVKLRLGRVEFDLENEHAEAMRDLAAHTVP